MGRNRQGLRKLSADLIDKARDETASQVVGLMLALVGAAAFCLLSLGPDIDLLIGKRELTVPGAGPVSFSGFMLLGPTILIVLRIYLQIYVEHNDRLNRIAQRMPVVRAPTLTPKNPLIRCFSGLTFYFLLPVTMLFFAWKAAVFPTLRGSGLVCVTAGVITSHATLPTSRGLMGNEGVAERGVAILLGEPILIRASASSLRSLS